MYVAVWGFSATGAEVGWLSDQPTTLEKARAQVLAFEKANDNPAAGAWVARYCGECHSTEDDAGRCRCR